MASKPRKSFIADFLDGSAGNRRTGDGSKHTIRADRWDKQDLAAVGRELPEFAEWDDKLSNFTDTGHHAYGDGFLELVKGMPELADDDEVMPKYLVNRHVMKEFRELREKEELKQYTVGDPVAAALADISFEPTFETIFDRLKEEQKLADQLQEMADQMGGMESDMEGLEGQLQEAQQGNAQAQGGRGPVDFQKKRKELQDKMDKLKDKMDKKRQELEDKLDKKKSQTQQSLKEAAKEAAEDAEATESAALMWGQEPGSLKRLDARKRLEFAKKVSNQKFKKIAQLIGPLSRLAMAMQSRKTEHGRDELYDISLGSDLSRLVPTEYLYLEDEDLMPDFHRRWIENQLLQYELRGVEKVAKGGIICLIDTSGSMGGDREIWAKAVALALLHIARKQKRSFYGCLFSSAGQIDTYDFRDTHKAVDPDQVANFASSFFGGGTDFMTPLSHAVDLLRQEFADKGAVKGDIVFITDGQCSVDEEWLERFCDERTELGFRTFGISIGGHPMDEPLAEICEKRVCSVADLVSGNDVREVFQAV